MINCTGLKERSTSVFNTVKMFRLFIGDHVGAMVTHSPPTSEVEGSNLRTLCGIVSSCLLHVGSLQYRNLTNCKYCFLLPTKLPVVI